MDPALDPGEPHRPDARFPRKRRLRKKEEYDRVFREGRRVHDASAMILWAPNDLAWSRLGLITGRKTGTAVRRNRARRVFREAFRLGEGGLPPGFDYVVVVRRKPEGWSRADAARVLREVSRRMGGESRRC